MVAYSLGQRDAMALILMEAKMNGQKLPDVATAYKENFGEHPTLDFHLK